MAALQNDPAFTMVRGEPAVLAEQLLARALDAAFLSPIDYARNASEYLIVPDSAVSSAEGNNAIVVHFREGATTVRTLAVPPASASDIITAKILLAERFDLNPSLVPVMGALEDMLAKADAALLVPDAALRYALARPNALDLVEEWVVSTELPYVHGFWAAREHALSAAELHTLATAGQRGYALLAEAGGPAAGTLETFSYDLTEDVREGIREFYRYAYFHGMLPDVPDLRFFDDTGSSASPDPAMN
jgi:predicted solute-binding protein